MLAGPNGAGKSTFYDAFLAESPLPFLNADIVAMELQLDSFEAARLLDATRQQRIDDGLGFITETVFSDPYGHKLTFLKDAISRDFDVTLVFVGIASVDLSARRVAQRVAEGGHDVPRDRLEKRFARSIANLREAVTFVPRVEIFDNSLDATPYRKVATFTEGELTWRMRGTIPSWCRDVVRARRQPTTRRR
jgi:predicted ABC-type ATPase